MSLRQVFLILSIACLLLGLSVYLLQPSPELRSMRKRQESLHTVVHGIQETLQEIPNWKIDRVQLEDQKWLLEKTKEYRNVYGTITIHMHETKEVTQSLEVALFFAGGEIDCPSGNIQPLHQLRRLSRIAGKSQKRDQHLFEKGSSRLANGQADGRVCPIPIFDSTGLLAGKRTRCISVCLSSNGWITPESVDESLTSRDLTDIPCGSPVLIVGFRFEEATPKELDDHLQELMYKTVVEVIQQYDKLK